MLNARELTDFRDLARSVMDIGTKIPFWLLEDRALLIWKPLQRQRIVLVPIPCPSSDEASLCTSSIGIVPLMINKMRAKNKNKKI